MRVFIPPEVRGVVHELALDSWATHKRWPRDRYLAIVDKCRAALADLGGEVMDDPDAIATTLATVLRQDAVYINYILHVRKVGMGDTGEWLDKCLAAAWVIVQTYNREVNNNSWQTDLSGE